MEISQFVLLATVLLICSTGIYFMLSGGDETEEYKPKGSEDNEKTAI